MNQPEREWEKEFDEIYDSKLQLQLVGKETGYVFPRYEGEYAKDANAAVKEFIRELLATREAEVREEMIRRVESIIAEFGDQGIETVSSILQEDFHGQREVIY